MRSLLIAVFALLALAVLPAAADDTCVCLNGGTRKSSTDLPNRCECTCTGDFQPPTCKYLAKEQMGVLYKFANTTAKPYKATGIKIKSLLEHFGYPKSTTGIIRLNRRLIESEPVDHSFVLALMAVNATVADTFVRDFDKVGASNDYYMGEAVLEVKFYEPEPSSASELAQSPMISGLIPWASISWIVGTVIMLIFFPILECILSSVCSGTTFCAGA